MTLCGGEAPRLVFALWQVWALQSLYLRLCQQCISLPSNSTEIFSRQMAPQTLSLADTPCNLLLFGEHSSFRLPLGHNRSLHKLCPPHLLNKILLLQGLFKDWSQYWQSRCLAGVWYLKIDYHPAIIHTHWHSQVASRELFHSTTFSQLIPFLSPLRHIPTSLFQSFITLSTKTERSIKNCHTQVIPCLSCRYIKGDSISIYFICYYLSALNISTVKVDFLL